MGSQQSDIGVFDNIGICHRGSNSIVVLVHSRLINSGNQLKIGVLGLLMALHMSASSLSGFSLHFSACLVATIGVILIIRLYRYPAPRRQIDVSNGYRLSNRYEITIPHDTGEGNVKAGGKYSMLYF